MVVDTNKNRFEVSRERLRHRVVVTTAKIGVSDDLKHDRFATDHWGRADIKWLEAHVAEYHADDFLPWDGIIGGLHTHSDNAAQHFKRFLLCAYITLPICCTSIRTHYPPY